MKLKGYGNNTIEGQLPIGYNKDQNKVMPQSFKYPAPMIENAEFLAQAI